MLGENNKILKRNVRSFKSFKWICCKGTFVGPRALFQYPIIRLIIRSHQAARFVFRIARLLWNLTVLPMCLSNSKAMRWFKLPISRLRNSETYWILKQGPNSLNCHENLCINSPSTFKPSTTGLWSIKKTTKNKTKNKQTKNSRPVKYVLMSS